MKRYHQTIHPLNLLMLTVAGIDREKCAMIITDRPDDICAALTEEFESGMTRPSAQGGYSGQPKTAVYFVMNRFQVVRMKELVHTIDPNAYITISEVADVFAANQNEK